MPTFLKIFGVVGLIFILGAASCAGLASYAVKDTKAVVADAKSFASAHDQYECESAALDKADACRGTICLVKAAAWHATCLTQATPNDGYCDGVPDPNHTVASEDWYAEACAKVQMSNDDNCQFILGATQGLCHNTEWKADSGGATVTFNN